MVWIGKHRKHLMVAGGYIVAAVLLDLSSGAFVLQTGIAICYPPAGLYLDAILLLGWRALPLAFLTVFSVLVTLQSPDIHLISVIGIGIALKYHEQIFGLFNKLNSQSEGTGIGLTLVQRIIEVHGGRIWVESELGSGCTFYFTLPRGKIEQLSIKP